MKTSENQTAARAILAAANSAISDAGLDIIAVNIRPGDPLRNRPGTVSIAWTAGPVWGELKLEFNELPLQLITPGKPRGKWERVNGTVSTPAGFPLLPSLSKALIAISTAAGNCADVELPHGALYVAAAE